MNNNNQPKRNTFPQQVVIEATAGCNQKCIFCGRTYMDRPKKTMERSVYDRIVEEIGRENPYAEIWPTFMGEAMLLGDRIFDMIEYAKECGCKKITLNTNGTRLNEKTLPRILTCGLNRFIVSCDAHTPETHRIVRPAIRENAPGLDAIYEGILELIKMMREQKLDAPLFEMQFSIFEENEHEVEAFRDFWIKQGVIVKIRPKVFWSGSIEGERNQDKEVERVPCLWSLETAAIHWNGNVVMCAVDCEGKYVAGNVQKQTLKEIWNGPLEWMRDLQKAERFKELPDICRKCKDWEVKKAHCFFPDDQTQERYETYINTGRQFSEEHFWNENRPMQS